jgi:hypothetical protein
MSKITQRLCICIGHSRQRIGAVGNGAEEHDEAAKVVYAAVDRFKGSGLPIEVVPEHLPALPDQIRWINDNFNKDDFLLNVHLNAAVAKSATGTEVWYYSGSTRSKELAKVVQSEQVRLLGIRDRGVHGDLSNSIHGKLGAIRDTEPYSILIELGFISNKSDLEKVRAHGADVVSAIITKFYSPANPFAKSENRVFETNFHGENYVLGEHSDETTPQFVALTAPERLKFLQDTAERLEKEGKTEHLERIRNHIAWLEQHIAHQQAK